MATHNLTRLLGNSLEATAKGIRAETMIFVADADKAVSNDIPLRFAQLKGSRVVRLKSAEGHNAFKLERELISSEALPFLDGVKPNSVFK
ncbi:MAG: hypothetical protein FJW36_14440 [Acidobacteria bacterium]|nr:hypothetical protein [Acidobacteriota bacterium]